MKSLTCENGRHVIMKEGHRMFKNVIEEKDGHIRMKRSGDVGVRNDCDNTLPYPPRPRGAKGCVKD